MLKNEKHSKNFSRPIVLISILGVVLGVSVIILTVSIATGFQNQIKNKLLSFGSHIQIESMFQSNNKETSPINLLNKNIDENKNLISIEEYAYKSAIIQLKNRSSSNEVEGLLFKGLESFKSNEFLNEYLIDGILPKFKNKVNDTVILSKKTCHKLNLKLNDKITTFFISNGNPRQRNLILGGIYETGLEKVDSKFGFIDLQYLKKINNWGLTLKTKYQFNSDSSNVIVTVTNKSKNGFLLYDWGNQIRVPNNQSIFSAKKDCTIKLIGFEFSNLKNNNLINIPDTLIIKYSAKQKIITNENIAGSDQYLCGGLEIYLSDFEKRNLVKQNLKANFGPEFKISTIDEQHQEIFAWLNLIYQNVYIILILMIAVAVINMSCALLVLIVEKTKMIGILKALGIRNTSLKKIFIAHGGLLLFVGFLGGNILAGIIVIIQNQIGFLKLPQENYYLDTVPMDYPIINILTINIIAFLFCFLAMTLPSIISSRISPVKAINSEI